MDGNEEIKISKMTDSHPHFERSKFYEHPKEGILIHSNMKYRNKSRDKT